MGQRFAAQLLTGEPARTAPDVVRRLLAVQGQDPRGLRLAIRPRSRGLSAADVDRALTTDRTLVVSWLNRGTLHLVSAEDYWWLHPLTTPQLRAGSARRLAQEQVPPADAERAVAVIEAALAADGPLTRGQLRVRLDAAGIRTAGQALVHVLFAATLRGLIIRGPVTATGDQAFVLVRDWLGPPPPERDPDQALAGLARRYLAGHGPASERDLAKWAGVPLGAARRGLSAIAGELAGRADGLAALRRLPPGPDPGAPPDPSARRPDPGARPGQAAAPGPPGPRLLGPFDPLLHGWVSRQPVLGAYQGIVTANGIFRPFALVGGQAAATWAMPAGQVTLAPLRPLTAAEQQALQADAADVQRYLAGSQAGQAG
jgi:hypothetical protein